MDLTHSVLAALFCSAVFVTYVVSEEAGSNQTPSTASIKQCMAEFGISETDLRSIDTPHTKVMGCIMRKDGLISADGKLLLDKALEMTKTSINDDVLRMKTDAATTECEKEINSSSRTDEDIAKMLLDCMTKAGIQN